MLKNYFIYYRVRADQDLESARASVRSMQLALEHRTGVRGRLFARCHEDLTWMEVYEGVTAAGDFEQALREGIEAQRLEALVEPGSARHAECFVECV